MKKDKIVIRQEEVSDQSTVHSIIEQAFVAIEHSDHREHHLVSCLRNSPAFIPELSLVASIGDEIIGHILLTKLTIKGKSKEVESLALAPVSVHPDYQCKGVGSTLIAEAHQRAKDLEYTSIVLIGHETYYPRFGYELASKYEVTLPFDVPDKNALILFLDPADAHIIQGEVVYPREFFE